MAEDVFKIPKSLRIALKEKRVVPFVGAGASIPVRKRNADGTMSDESLFLLWKDFIEFLIQGMRDENKSGEAEFISLGLKTKRMTYLDALEEIQEILGKGVWYELFEKCFGFLESEAHPDSFKLNRLIWELSNNLIITTNIDRVLYWACPKPLDFNLLNVQKVKFAQLQNEKTIKRPTVWHLHGHIDHVEEIIFTSAQFESFYKQKDNEAKFQKLISFLTQCSFVFIGFSLDDDYLRELLQYIHDIYQGGADSYYILFRERDIASANFPEYVTPVPFADFGKPLEDLVEELARIAKEDDGKGGNNFESGNAQSSNDIKKDVKKDFFNVPYRSKGDEFVGRKGKKEEIWTALNKNGCASIGQAVSVKGLGGFGKTQLAVEFADAYKDRYKNGVYWLVADSNIENQIVQIADERGWINKYDKDIDQPEVAKEKFRTLSDCLILVDNVENFDDVKDYLPKTDSHTHLLITSREKDGRFHEIDIDLLNKDESRKLLQKVSGRNPKDIREKAELEKILGILGGIPLAIELVGGFLKERRDISLSEYLGYLENYPLSELEEEFPKNSFTYHDHSIIRTLRISEKTIEKKPLLAEILKVLAWSGKSSMGVSFLKALVLIDNDFKFRIAISDAVNLRLISRDEKDERYTIHRLLAKVFSSEHKFDEESNRFLQIVEKLTQWADNNSDNLSDFELELPHLNAWQDKIFEKFPENYIRIKLAKAYSFTNRGLFKDAKNEVNKLLKIYQEKPINNKDLLLKLHRQIGIIEGEIGNYPSELENKCQVLNICEELYGEKHADIATALNGIGVALTHQGNHLEALKYKKRAFRLRKQLFGEKHKDTAQSLNNIGITYGYLGKYSLELEYKERALKIREQLFAEAISQKLPFKDSQKLRSKTEADVASSYNFVGIAYEHLGKYEIALEYKKKALDQRQRLFGKIHSAIANSHNNIGITYGLLGKYEKAFYHTNKAYEMREQLLDKEHPDILRSLNDLGVALRNKGEYEEALKYQLEALKIRQKKFGDRHLITASSLVNVGITYLKSNNYTKAVEYLNPAFEIRRESLLINHPETIKAGKYLITVLKEVGEINEAQKLAEEFLIYLLENNPNKQFFERIITQ